MAKHTNILILTAMHKRPKVSKLFAMAINRWIKASPLNYNIFILAAVSDDESEQVCKDFDISYIYTENKSVSHKWNVAMTEAMNLTWDYVMITGDDDLYSDEFWNHIESRINLKVDYFGLRSIYFYEPQTKEACKFKYPFDKMIGCGRFMSRELVTTCLPLWDDGINNGLDKSSEDNILSHGFERDFIDTSYPLAVDIKTNVNIWSLNSYAGHSKAAYFHEIKFIAPEERDYINNHLS